MGLGTLLLLSACQKDIDNESEKNMAGSSINSRHGDNNWDDDDDEYDNDDELVFYALGAGNKLDKFEADESFEMKSSVTITGLAGTERILAIDFRPATGELYGLGSTSRIYVINPQTGGARVIGAGPFTPVLAGTLVGFDFNPTVDRIRVVTNTGQNLRLNPETGTVASVDGNINGVANAMITSVAYTNNIAAAITTTLYDIDITTDKLYKQNPPNNGTLEEIGSLNINLEGEGGFDIAAPANSNSSYHSGTTNYNALALYQVNQKSTLLSIDLNTGNARKIDKFNSSRVYFGIAIPTQPVAYAVSGNSLLIFNPNKTSGAVTKSLSGLQGGESLVGIDFRPVNGQIHGVGSNSRLYTINTSNGAASFEAALSVPLNGTSFGVDFNPVVDRIRIVSNNGQNLRVHPFTGAATVDASLNPGTPSVNAASYANNFAGTTTTTLYVIDAAKDKLYIQNPPNAGTLTEVGSLGVDINANNGLDIGSFTKKNRAYGVFTSAGNTSIYKVDLNKGKAKAKGSLQGPVTGFTIGLGF